MVIFEQGRISNNLIDFGQFDGPRAMQSDNRNLKATALIHSSCTAIAQAELFKQIYFGSKNSLHRFVKVLEGSDRLRGYSRRATSLMICNDEYPYGEMDFDRVDRREIGILFGEIKEFYIDQWEVKPADLGNPNALYARTMLTIPSRLASFQRLEILSTSHITFERLLDGSSMDRLRVLKLCLGIEEGFLRLPAPQLLHSFLPALQTLHVRSSAMPSVPSWVPASSYQPLLDGTRPVTPHLTDIHVDIKFLSYVIPLLESTSIPPTHVNIVGNSFHQFYEFSALAKSLNGSRTKQFEKLSICITPCPRRSVADWRTQMRKDVNIMRLVKACQEKGCEMELFYQDEDFGPLVGF
jgi:hypothetical protein